MREGPQNLENSLEQKQVELEINFSKEREIYRIRGALDKIEWYRSNGYKVKLPKEIEILLDQEGEITDEMISHSIDSSFKKEEYQTFSEDLKTRWKEQVDSFMEKLSTLGRPLQTSYRVSLTKYGTGGSYNPPDAIVLNFASGNSYGFSVIKHEIIHLTIQDLIEKYKIKHWVKERLVDLISSKFFGGEMSIQREEDIMQEVSDIFELYFPDIEKVIVEISKLEQYVDTKE